MTTLFVQGVRLSLRDGPKATGAQRNRSFLPKYFQETYGRDGGAGLEQVKNFSGWAMKRKDSWQKDWYWRKQWGMKVYGCSGILMRLVCTNKLFILNVNLWGKLAYGSSSCQKY